MGRMREIIIDSVDPESIASRLLLLPGDRIVSLNGRIPADLIQFRWEWAGERVRLEVQTKVAIKRFTIHKGYDEGFGAQFERPVFDKLRTCANRCVFCFVDQMPPGCRESLYIKDDDFRLSFLQGSFVTLTNLSARDRERIENEKLSPLYVSVHATEPGVRGLLLGNKKPDRLMETMTRLSEAGIEFHCQVVLCPGYNDGEVLQRTVEDLSSLRSVLSLAVVPVGLTRFREGLAEIRPVSAGEARTLTAWAAQLQERFLNERGTRFIWLSDEFYILAGQELPDGEDYEDYSQWENGVGLVRGLLDETERYALPEALPREQCLYLAGGTAAMKALAPLWDRLSNIGGLSLKLLPLENRFFGPSVNVSGLLTGKCLIEGLGSAGLPAGAAVYLPEAMIRDTGDRFLDGMTVSEASARLGNRLVFLPQEGGALLSKLMEEAGAAGSDAARSKKKLKKILVTQDE